MHDQVKKEKETKGDGDAKGSLIPELALTVHGKVKSEEGQSLLGDVAPLAT